MHDIDIDAPNPIHQHSSAHVGWTTVNAAENIPGILTPLGYDFWIRGVDIGAHAAFATFGVISKADAWRDRPEDDRVGGAFYGRFAVNFAEFSRLADLTPGGSGADFQKTIFGEVRSESLPSGFRLRYLLVAVKTPPLLAVLPWLVRRRVERTSAWWRAFTTGTGRTSDRRAQLAEALSTMQRAVCVQMYATFVAQGLYDRIGMLAKEAGQPGLQLRVCTGYGGLEETRMVTALNDVAHGRRSLADFLSMYGARCTGENDLSAYSWRERSGMVETLAAKYRAAPDDREPEQRIRARAVERKAAERELLALLPPVRRLGARAVLRLARRYIPLREEAKSIMALAMDAGRYAARNLGSDLVASGHLDEIDDVFQLTLAEARGEPSPDFRALVAHRLMLRAEYEKLDLPTCWFGNPDPVPLRETEPDDREVVGLPAACGIAEGRARVVLDVDDIDLVEIDEILVCRTTDPSWASVFHLVSAAVIDIGGVGSHGAIVSREMGLPCVINTGHGTSTLRSGDLVRVDGTEGTVTVLERAVTPAADPTPMTEGAA